MKIETVVPVGNTPGIFVGNAFAIPMLEKQVNTLRFTPLSGNRKAADTLEEFVNNGWQAVSCVGHADTASLLSEMLGTEVPMNRIAVRLEHRQDVLLVGQLDLNGKRLPEGCKELPEGVAIQWWLVTQE